MGLWVSSSGGGAMKGGRCRGDLDEVIAGGCRSNGYEWS